MENISSILLMKDMTREKRRREMKRQRCGTKEKTKGI
jgi:hypothetical protein